MYKDIEFHILDDGKEIDAKTAYMELQKRLFKRCIDVLPNSMGGYILSMTVLFEPLYIYSAWVIVFALLVFLIGILILNTAGAKLYPIIIISLLLACALVIVFGAFLTKRHVDKLKAELENYAAPDDAECRNILNRMFVKLDSPLLHTTLSEMKKRKERLDTIVFLMERNIVSYKIAKDEERIDILYEDPESHNVFEKVFFVDLRQNTQIETPILTYADARLYFIIKWKS